MDEMYPPDSELIEPHNYHEESGYAFEVEDYSADDPIKYHCHDCGVEIESAYIFCEHCDKPLADKDDQHYEDMRNRLLDAVIEKCASGDKSYGSPLSYEDEFILMHSHRLPPEMQPVLTVDEREEQTGFRA